MPFIPHTEAEISAMLKTLGLPNLAACFDEIPNEILYKNTLQVPAGINEQALKQLFADVALALKPGLNFMGAGAYEHHIPAAVWDIANRGEFLTAYTPYQAEMSQGLLQLLYEFQSMIVSLTGMEVANASMYDGASALGEAALMAVRVQGKKANNIIAYLDKLHPHYMATLETLTKHQGITLVPLREAVDYDALIISQPNFHGECVDVHSYTKQAHAAGALVIAVVNPISLGVLCEPGAWGEQGADIVCGEGQPLGVPLNYGGPYFGFFATKKALIRQMPGRLSGRTQDAEGNSGFVLTLQAREQHIRRSKATSNICTNQGLLVVAATIHLSLLGEYGFLQLAKTNYTRAHACLDALTTLEGVQRVSCVPFFNEFVIQTDWPVEGMIKALAKKAIYPGYPVADNQLLCCVTETKTSADIATLVCAIQQYKENNLQ